MSEKIYLAEKEYVDNLVNGVVVAVDVSGWVQQEDGTYTNTITVDELTGNETLDVSLYGEPTEEQAEVFDFLITSIDSQAGKVVLTASEEVTVAFSILLRGRVSMGDKNVYISDMKAGSVSYDNSKSKLDATDSQNAIDELATCINGLVVSVTSDSWDLQEDGTYKKIIPVEQITGKETLDVCLYPGDVHTESQIVAFSELITSIETAEGMIILTSVEEITVAFRIFLYGKVNFDKNNLVAVSGDLMEVVEMSQEDFEKLSEAEKAASGLIHVYDGDGISAENIPYDGSETGLGDNVQDAIDNQSKNLTASDNLKFRFATDGEGNYGYLGADDSFIPFKSGGSFALFNATFSGSNDSLSSGNATTTIDISTFPDYENLTTENFLMQVNTYGRTYYSGSSGTTTHYTSIPRITNYDPSTGQLTMTSGKYGFGNTNSGAYFLWARDVKVVVFK